MSVDLEYQRTVPAARAGCFDIDRVLVYCFEHGGSDLHLEVGLPPGIRANGRLGPVPGHPPLRQEELFEALMGTITPRQRALFEEEMELDYSYSLGDRVSFRANLFWQRGTIGAAFRVIPREIKSLAQLGMPASLASLAGLPRGLVLVCGPTGSGKSTTLAALIDVANRTRADHIITIEDPIEFLHTSNRCIVAQREVGVDTKSFAQALKRALRQDPDIILVGEMRDRETMAIALRAAETGHLVFATIHTQDTAESITRIVDEFPGPQQDQIRTQLASTLQAVVSQTLCPTADATGRVAATEVMVATPAIRALIRDGRLHQIYGALQTGRDLGMHTLDQSLAELVRGHRIRYETGLERARQPREFDKMCGRLVRMNQGLGSLQQAAPARPLGRM
ncbi:MAG: type IV pilus twitching motility protein PilT [Bifidobacteriaceae bacterium]|jgi:twitching motility protein PilT|nr:type IV pilus twitching motility protein PilT [Bifidobacteriaceae bacterium]